MIYSALCNHQVTLYLQPLSSSSPKSAVHNNIIINLNRRRAVPLTRDGEEHFILIPVYSCFTVLWWSGLLKRQCLGVWWSLWRPRDREGKRIDDGNRKDRNFKNFLIFVVASFRCRPTNQHSLAALLLYHDATRRVIIIETAAGL